MYPAEMFVYLVFAYVFLEASTAFFHIRTFVSIWYFEVSHRRFS